MDFYYSVSQSLNNFFYSNLRFLSDQICLVRMGEVYSAHSTVVFLSWGPCHASLLFCAKYFIYNIW